MNPLMLMLLMGSRGGNVGSKIIPFMFNPMLGMLGLITNKRVGMTDLFLSMMNPTLGLFSMISKPPIRRRRYRRSYRRSYRRRRY